MRFSAHAVRFMQIGILLALAFLLVSGSADTAKGDDEAATKSENSASEKRILDALNASTTPIFQDIKLSKMTRLIAIFHEIPIVIDQAELKKRGIDPDVKINNVIKRISLRSALALAFEPHGLGWKISDNKLVITTAEDVADQQATVIYSEYEKLQDIFGTEEAQQAKREFQAAVRSTIDPKNWKETGGKGSMAWGPHGLTVINNQSVQNQMKQLTWYLTQGQKILGPNSTVFPLDPTAGGSRAASTLESQAALEFVELPLRDVRDFLQTVHDILIPIDENSLNEAGVSPDSPVTYQVANVSLQQALDDILVPLELDYVLQHEVLIITTKEKANELLKTRIYNVKELFGKKINPTFLTKYLTAKVSPDSWSKSGGKAALANFSNYLLVYQSQRAHREILKHLEKLKRRVEGEIVEEP